MADIIACSKDWFLESATRTGFALDSFSVITERQDLSENRLREENPRYIFFPHWNWRVPENIWNRYECVVFHIAPLPFGRGGSPIQNLIARGFSSAPVNALRMVGELDAGPIYLSTEISLEGTLSEIFVRAATVIEDQIVEIQTTSPEAIEQTGNPVVFSRLTREDNRIDDGDSLDEIWNKIRMVDADGYPDAHFQLETTEVLFTRARYVGNEIVGTFRFKEKK